MILSLQQVNIKISQQITKFTLSLKNIQYIRYAIIENINWRIRDTIYDPNDNIWIRIEDTLIKFNKNNIALWFSCGKNYNVEIKTLWAEFGNDNDNDNDNENKFIAKVEQQLHWTYISSIKSTLYEAEK